MRSCLIASIGGNAIQKVLFGNSKMLKCALTIHFMFFATSILAATPGKVIKCEPHGESNTRSWLVTGQSNQIQILQLYKGGYYQFCENGYYAQISSDTVVCAFDRKIKPKSLATAINVKTGIITDILISNDTKLTDPASWKQTSETNCTIYSEIE